MGLVQVYWDKTASRMKCVTFVVYPVHDVLLNSDAQLRESLLYNEHTLVGFLLVQCEVDYSTFQGIDERECTENSTTSDTS